jgi:hypothetical protein
MFLNQKASENVNEQAVRRSFRAFSQKIRVHMQKGKVKEEANHAQRFTKAEPIRTVL